MAEAGIPRQNDPLHKGTRPAHGPARRMPTARRRKGELEVEVRDVVVRFKKEYLRRGPAETRAFLIGDRVLVCSRDNLTPAEADLAGAGHGAELIRQVYREQVEQGRELLRAALEEVLGVAVRAIHADLCPRTGEAVLVLSLDGRPDAAD